MEPIRILLVDDHAVVREGIRLLANTEPAIKVVGEANDGQDAVNKVEQLLPDVVVMDLVMPGQNSVEAIRKIKQKYLDVKIIVLTRLEDEYIVNEAMKAGADGYLLKDADGEYLFKAIKAVYRGEIPIHPRITKYLLKDKTAAKMVIDQLTQRQQEVLQLVALGLSNRTIAEQLRITEGTVKIHVRNILAKLNVSNRVEAAMLAVQLGLTDKEADEDTEISKMA